VRTLRSAPSLQFAQLATGAISTLRDQRELPNSHAQLEPNQRPPQQIPIKQVLAAIARQEATVREAIRQRPPVQQATIAQLRLNQELSILALRERLTLTPGLLQMLIV
jgi:hypothetical protein